jgi:serine/threonine protein kinase
MDIFSYGVMMMHVLSGQWPFPGEAVRVNPRNPNNPSDVVGVTEFDRREEYINLIGNEHPLMTLIQGCLSNSPSHRPTSSEVHQRVSAVAADHPPSFTNRVEMMDRIKTLSQENERVLAKNNTAVPEKNREIAEAEQLLVRLLEMQQIMADLIKQNEAKQERIDQLVGELTVQGEDNSDLVKEVEQLKQELACTQENLAELVGAGPNAIIVHQPM